MATLYYGGGDCTVEGNVSSIGIAYKGNILIDSKLPDSYRIELYKGKLVINPSSQRYNLNELLNRKYLMFYPFFYQLKTLQLYLY